jgi:vancomycin aglycone glucosyltransferase
MALAFMPIRQWVDEAKRAPIDLPKLAAKMVPTQYEAIHAAAAGCDARRGNWHYEAFFERLPI